MTTQDPPAVADHGPRGETPAVIRLLIVAVLLALAVTPTVILLGLLAGSGGAAPAALAVLSTVFVGPALSAALYALGERARDDGAGPAAAFAKGYRINAGDVLKQWVPTLAMLALLLFTLVNSAGRSPGWAVGLAIGATVIVLLVLVNATVIASFFTFRGRDVAKLAVYFLGRLPRVTLLVLVLLVVAGVVVVLFGPALFALLGALWAALLLKAAKPLLAEVRLRFVDG